MYFTSLLFSGLELQLHNIVESNISRELDDSLLKKSFSAFRGG